MELLTTKNNALEVFSYKNQQVRTVEQDGQVWFVAKDVWDVLGLSDVSMATRILDDDEKMTLQNLRSHSGQRGGAQFVNVISEPGLYKLIFRSNKPEAKEFTRWVTHELLPQVRQHGMYLSGKALAAFKNDPNLFNKMVECYEESQRKIAELEKKIEDSQSYTTLAKVVLGLPGSITFQEAANFLSQHGFKTGQNRLFKMCRDKKFLCSRKGKQFNRPTQRSVEKGLFSVETRGGFKPVTLITPKGLQTLSVLYSEQDYPLLVQMEEPEAIEA